jgi:hypothetical protein
VIQSALASPRFSRLLFWLGAAVLAAGIVVFIANFLGGDEKTGADLGRGSKATLPAKSKPASNADRGTARTYSQLDAEVKSTVRTFIRTAVARKNLGESWSVIAPEMKAGYTYKQWKNAKELPIVPYPVDDVDNTNYHLEYAKTDEILVEVGLSAPPKLHLRATTFWLGLVPVGKGAKRRWLVNYWMPRWTPPIPVN